MTLNHRPLHLPAVVAGLLFASHTAAQPPLTWQSTYTEAPPRIDGAIDPVWERAVPLSVTIREAFGGGAPREVELRALHDDEAIYVLARWPDATRSDLRDPWLWNPASGEYQRPTTPDDQFALEFPLSGDFNISMLPPGVSYVADVWHWKAGRSNLDGWVDDKRHIISPEPVEEGLPYNLGGRGMVYIARPMDAGTAPYEAVDKPDAYQGDAVSSYRAAPPSGSLADIPGKGVHDGSGWTLEMTRKFDTGHDDDAVLDPAREVPTAIAVLDDELYWEHSVSELLLLRFQPAATTDCCASSLPRRK